MLLCIGFVLFSCAEEAADINPIEVADTELAIEEEGAFICYITPMPTFPGGMRAWNDFVKQHLKYPAIQECIEGRVMFALTVDKEGRMKDISILQSPHPKLGEEALRVLKLSPNWIPAEVYDRDAGISKLVETRISLFIRFRQFD
ncbi:TonB family protein [Roseivirga pacifica]|uniref:TonB family protein n=1 Tax=Roseivirga pacifica TaxID=1267423 RepID=UPI00227A6C55|nr:TonB family protein [Roseivirga pacifica]